MVDEDELQSLIEESARHVLCSVQIGRSSLATPVTCYWRPGEIKGTSMGVGSLLSLQKVNTNPALQGIITDLIRGGREYLAQNAGEHGTWFRPMTVQDLTAASTVIKAGGGFGSSKGNAFWKQLNRPSTPRGANVSFFMACLAVECCYFADRRVDFLDPVREFLEDKLETESDPTKLAWVILSLRRIDRLDGARHEYEEALSRLQDLCVGGIPTDGTDRAYLGYNLLELNVTWDVVDDIADEISRTYEVDRFQNLQETEAYLRFLTEYAVENLDGGCAIKGEYIDELQSKMTADDIDFLTREELFPILQQRDGRTIDEDMSEDDLIEKLIAFLDDNEFRIDHKDVKAHSGVEIADIYPVEFDHDGSTWKVACVVKGPDSETLTMKDISYQITKPAGIDSIDYIVLFNAKESGANLSEQLSELSHNLLDKEVIYISKPDVATMIA
jgi:hypothetical protein